MKNKKKQNFQKQNFRVLDQNEIDNVSGGVLPAFLFAAGAIGAILTAGGILVGHYAIPKRRGRW